MDDPPAERDGGVCVPMQCAAAVTATRVCALLPPLCKPGHGSSAAPAQDHSQGLLCACCDDASTHDVNIGHEICQGNNGSGRDFEQLSRATGHARPPANDLNNDSVPSGLPVVGSDSPGRSGSDVASRLHKVAPMAQPEVLALRSYDSSSEVLPMPGTSQMAHRKQGMQVVALDCCLM